MEIKTKDPNKINKPPKTTTKRLDLSRGSLTEPPIETLKKLPKVVKLNLESNVLTSLRGLEIFQNLTEVYFANNRLNEIHSDFFNLINLKILSLNRNRLVGLPEEIGNLKKLEILLLSSNFLKYLPPAIGRLEKLKILDLSNNSRLRRLPVHLSLLLSGKLKKIDLHGDPLLTYPPSSVIPSVLLQPTCSTLCSGSTLKKVLEFLKKEIETVSGVRDPFNFFLCYESPSQCIKSIEKLIETELPDTIASSLFKMVDEAKTSFKNLRPDKDSSEDLFDSSMGDDFDEDIIHDLETMRERTTSEGSVGTSSTSSTSSWSIPNNGRGSMGDLHSKTKKGTEKMAKLKEREKLEREDERDNIDGRLELISMILSKASDKNHPLLETLGSVESFLQNIIDNENDMVSLSDEENHALLNRLLNVCSKESDRDPKKKEQEPEKRAQRQKDAIWEIMRDNKKIQDVYLVLRIVSFLSPSCLARLIVNPPTVLYLISFFVPDRVSINLHTPLDSFLIYVHHVYSGGLLSLSHFIKSNYSNMNTFQHSLTSSLLSSLSPSIGSSSYGNSVMMTYFRVQNHQKVNIDTDWINSNFFLSLSRSFNNNLPKNDLKLIPNISVLKDLSDNLQIEIILFHSMIAYFHSFICSIPEQNLLPLVTVSRDTINLPESQNEIDNNTNTNNGLNNGDGLSSSSEIELEKIESESIEISRLLYSQRVLQTVIKKEEFIEDFQQCKAVISYFSEIENEAKLIQTISGLTEKLFNAYALSCTLSRSPFPSLNPSSRFPGFLSVYYKSLRSICRYFLYLYIPRPNQSFITLTSPDSLQIVLTDIFYKSTDWSKWELYNPLRHRIFDSNNRNTIREKHKETFYGFEFKISISVFGRFIQYQSSIIRYANLSGFCTSSELTQMTSITTPALTSLCLNQIKFPSFSLTPPASLSLEQKLKRITSITEMGNKIGEFISSRESLRVLTLRNLGHTLLVVMTLFNISKSNLTKSLTILNTESLFFESIPQEDQLSPKFFQSLLTGGTPTQEKDVSVESVNESDIESFNTKIVTSILNTFTNLSHLSIVTGSMSTSSAVLSNLSIPSLITLSLEGIVNRNSLLSSFILRHPNLRLFFLDKTKIKSKFLEEICDICEKFESLPRTKESKEYFDKQTGEDFGELVVGPRVQNPKGSRLIIISSKNYVQDYKKDYIDKLNERTLDQRIISFKEA